MSERVERFIVDPDLAAPALLYLFASDVLPAAHFSLGQLFGVHHDVHLPCDRGRVALGPLEAHLFAWGFWQLHVDGAIRLEHDPSVPRSRKLDWLGLDALASRAADTAARSDMLEEEIFAACPPEPTPVSKIIVE